jgi:excisionase family DNA binding protein
METYLTVNDVALLVKMSVQSIRRYTMNKEIPFHKINNRAVRFKKIEIEQWVEKRKDLKAKKQSKNPEAGLFNEAELSAETLQDSAPVTEANHD